MLKNRYNDTHKNKKEKRGPHPGPWRVLFPLALLTSADGVILPPFLTTQDTYRELGPRNSIQQSILNMNSVGLIWREN